jgi:octaprenyl-diphosphate synthase
MLNNRTVDIGKILDAYSSELRLVEEHLEDMFSHDNPLVQAIGKHLLKSGGKRLRPLFLLLSARISGYNGGRDHIALASVVEVIHTASLLHDDVVDGAELRRGNPSANALWGNSAVVLAGDYLYSNALKYALTFAELGIIRALSSAVTRMTEGELMQMKKSSDVSITEEEYVHIVSAKTGALFSEACRVGAILGGVSQEQEKALAGYGMNVGIAFQMMDDILDYMADEGELGKKLGKDLEEGKITLPIILLLRAATPGEKKEVESIVASLSDDGLGRISDLISRYNVIEESLGRAEAVVEEAKAGLAALPASEEQGLMMEIADYALYREK